MFRIRNGDCSSTALVKAGTGARPPVSDDLRGVDTSFLSNMNLEDLKDYRTLAMAGSSGLSGEYSGQKLLIFTSIYIPAQIICVAFRYLARYLVKGPWGLDDIVVLASLVLQLTMGIISVCSVYFGGVGYHIPYLERFRPDAVVIWGKYLVAISSLYFWTVNIPKIAILALYHRLFPNKTIRRTVYLLVGALVVQTLATGTTAFAACRPFAANWDPKIPGSYCIDKEGLFRWASFPNIITDIIILVLPMRTIWHLQTSRRLKFGLIATFAVGSFGLVGSIIRFTIFFQKNSFIDGTWSAVDLVIWTQLETGTYLMSACLMTYRPLLERVGRQRLFRKSWHSEHSAVNVDQNRNHYSANIALQPRPQKGRTGFLPLGGDSSADSQILVTTDIQVAHKNKNQDSRLDPHCCHAV